VSDVDDSVTYIEVKKSFTLTKFQAFARGLYIYGDRAETMRDEVRKMLDTVPGWECSPKYKQEFVASKKAFLYVNRLYLKPMFEIYGGYL